MFWFTSDFYGEIKFCQMQLDFLFEDCNKSVASNNLLCAVDFSSIYALYQEFMHSLRNTLLGKDQFYIIYQNMALSGGLSHVSPPSEVGNKIGLF